MAVEAELRIVDEALDELLSSCDPRTTEPIEFWGSQFDRGLAWPHFSQGDGGLGVAPKFQSYINERLVDAGGSIENIAANVIGYGMGAPTVATHGTVDQRRRWLRPLFTAEEVWCQLFSEPGAGSDVAGLSTRAERDGDEWVINGQKVWTTLAHTSLWGMLLARTDPDLPKHRGLTYFIIDMDQPGIEVRPLRQLTGESEFNEVYFNDALVPDRYRLGERGDGWRVSITTLMNERVFIGASPPAKGEGAIAEAVAAWERSSARGAYDRDELSRLWVEAEAVRMTNMAGAAARDRGVPGPAGSTAKLHWAELNKRIHEFALRMHGAEGMLYPTGYDQGVSQASRPNARTPQNAFLRARANSIEGGTSEIMKNIVGERVLGLPGEPRGDKDIPWTEVPRS